MVNLQDEDETSAVPTPPDSPQTAARERASSNGGINPDVEIYAIESNESKSNLRMIYLLKQRLRFYDMLQINASVKAPISICQ